MEMRLMAYGFACLAIVFAPAESAAQSLRDEASQKVLAFFNAHRGENIDAFLAGLRPDGLVIHRAERDRASHNDR